MSIGFERDGAVAAPQQTPMPPVAVTGSGTVSNTPFSNSVLTALQAIPNATWTTVIDWVDVEEEGVTGIGDMWFVDEPGVYGISVRLAYPSNSTGNRYVRLMISGTQVAYYLTNAVPGASTFVQLYDELRLDTDDDIVVQTHQTSGGSLSLMGTSSGYNKVTIHKIRD